MNTGTSDPNTLFGTQVLDQAGNKIGTVDGVWVDDATDELEFVGVKTGWLMGKTHVIPATDADLSESSITVPYAQEQVKDAPSFGTDDELSPENEDAIYSHYGLNRSTAPSPSGLPNSEQRTNGTVDRAASEDAGDGDMPTPPQHAEMNLHEEELQVGKRTVKAGNVRLRKVVHTEHQEVPVDLRREEIEIEHVPASGASTGSTFEEQEINVPLMREEAVVNKASRATEQVHLNKTAQSETQTVGGEVRSEEVEIDQGTVGEYVHTPDERR